MEVVMLNERLREGFSPLLKLLRAPYAVSTLHPSNFHALPPQSADSGDRFTQHCRQMLWRLNSYQYGSASAFLLDLEQLERSADSGDQKQQVNKLRELLAVSEGEKQSQESVGIQYLSGGEQVTLLGSSGVLGLQEVAKEGEETSWLCNVTLQDQAVTIGSFETREKALEGYAEQVKQMGSPAGFAKLRKLGEKKAVEQREADKKIVKEAVALCHPRLASMKTPTVMASAPAPAANGSAGPRTAPRSATKSVAAAASPVASPVATEAVPASSTRPSLRSSTKRQKVEAATATPSTNPGSYLRLRRMIQRRLCRHLKAKEVCVVENPEALGGTRLHPKGRLEAGKVFSYRRKKQMTFAAFVSDELGHSVSACEHIFLVQERASIDDHLKVCGAFSDKEPAARSRAQTSAAKTRKSSRGTH